MPFGKVAGVQLPLVFQEPLAFKFHVAVAPWSVDERINIDKKDVISLIVVIPK
jgi:hypothetical protein